MCAKDKFQYELDCIRKLQVKSAFKMKWSNLKFKMRHKKQSSDSEYTQDSSKKQNMKMGKLRKGQGNYQN